MKKRQPALTALKAYSPAIGLLGFAVTALLAYLLIMPHRFASAEEYLVKGFDVSHHQGEIQWKKISPIFQFIMITMLILVIMEQLEYIMPHQEH